jgi:hypothetical protein
MSGNLGDTVDMTQIELLPVLSNELIILSVYGNDRK